MNLYDILQFIFAEMQKAINENNKDRVLELGTAIDVLYESSKKYGNRKAVEILERLNYVVFHYEDGFSFVEEYEKEIQQMIFEIGTLETRNL